MLRSVSIVVIISALVSGGITYATCCAKQREMQAEVAAVFKRQQDVINGAVTALQVNVTDKKDQPRKGQGS